MSHLYYTENWFHADISAHDAIDMLERQPQGSFLFRPSSSPGFLSLSYKGVKSDTSVHHIRVACAPGGTYTTDGDPKAYTSLALLVKARNSILLNPIYVTKQPPPGGNYDILPQVAAMKPPPPSPVSVQALVASGYTAVQATQALQECGGSVEHALVKLGGAGRRGAGRAAGINVRPTHQGLGGRHCTMGGGAGALHGPYGVTDDQNVSHKSYMEDGYAVVPNLAPNAAFFAVYDGHSGREAVDYIQLQLHNNLLAGLKGGLSVVEAFTNAYRVTDQQLADMGILKAGSTAVTALITQEPKGRVLHVANAGDARAVLCKGGVAERLSFDHKVEDESETKRITDAGGVILWGRVQGQTMVSRSLGDHDLKKYVISDPFYSKRALSSRTGTGDFLIIACDGVWDVLSDQQAVDVIKGGRDPQAMSAKLVEATLAAKCKDNITAMIVLL